MDGTDDEDNPAMDPFIAQERVFSKYAAMLYTSPDGGKVYHEFKDAKYCASCGEKVHYQYTKTMFTSDGINQIR